MGRVKAGKRSLPAIAGKVPIGQPVCAMLKDGTYYIGKVAGVQNGELLLAGVRGDGKLRLRVGEPDRAQISGFVGSLIGGGADGGTGADFGSSLGSGGGAGSGGEAGGAGSLGNMMQMIRIGMSMLQMIWPLFGMFRV